MDAIYPLFEAFNATSGMYSSIGASYTAHAVSAVNKGHRSEALFCLTSAILHLGVAVSHSLHL